MTAVLCSHCGHTKADHNTWWGGCSRQFLFDPCFCSKDRFVAETVVEREAREKQEDRDFETRGRMGIL